MLSANALCQSWVATDKSINRKVFIKASNPDSELDSEEIKSILSNSFTRQKYLKNHNILTPTRIRREQNNIFIEYPYLDSSSWTPLNLKMQGVDFPGLIKIMTSIAVIVDFVHMMGYVHGDLKLENFLSRTGSDGLDLKLIDLEFLQTADRPPRHKIFGTPGHIAPEIIKNDIILAKSDIYSLGISLRNLIEKHNVGHGNGIPADFTNLIDEMTRESHMTRPQYILDALHKHAFIDDFAYKKSLTEVLKLQLKNKLRELAPKIGRGKLSLNDFIIKENNVFGICFDFLDDLSNIPHTKFIDGLKLIIHLLQEASLTRFGSFWQVKISDELYRDLFASLSRIGGYEDYLLIEKDNINDAVLHDTFARLDDLASRRHNMKACLLIVDVIERLGGTNSITTDNLSEAYRRLINILDINGRFTKAAEYSLKAFEIPEFSPERRLETMHDIVRLSIKSGAFSTAAAYVDKAIEEARRLRNMELEFRLGRNRAHMLFVEGNPDKAMEDLNALSDRALAAGSTVEQARTYLSMGNVAMSLRQLREAEIHYLKGLSVCKPEDDSAGYLVGLLNIARLYHEMGDYRKSIKYGKEAEAFCENGHDAQKTSGVHSVLLEAYTRFCDFKNADSELNKFIYTYRSSGENIAYRLFYTAMGFLLLNRGLYEQAKLELGKVLDFYVKNEDDRIRGSAYTNMAWILMYEGNTEQCREFCEKAREVYTRFKEKESLLELSMLDALNENGPGMNDRLISVYWKFVANNSTYNAAFCLLNILINDATYDLIDEVQDSDLMKLIQDQHEVSIFYAIDILISDIRDASRDNQKTIASLKKAYRVLYKTGKYYLALLTCKKIADKYGEIKDHKLTARFLQQAYTIAKDIGNVRLEGELKARHDKISQLDRGDDKLLHAMHRISEIMQSMDDVEEALENLVRLGIELTGAERGVLLLWDYNAQKYQVKAEIDCDEESLNDIREVSNNVISSVLKEPDPIIIKNAQSDDRTKSHRSIIANNILSVLCVPIPGGERVNGVLYLDHHTIPALFEDSDLIYIKAVANFISISITKIWDLKKTRADKLQLLEELQRAGAGRKFITENQKTLNMLTELKQIAPSNLSVLLEGESGTGKEILARMVHETSSRAKMPFMVLNCPNIDPGLAESQLFGIDPGVATTVAGREGIFTLVDGGTLFLDEIADMPLEIQAKMLRAIETQEYVKAGGNKVLYADIRFVFATNKDMEQLVEEGKFRKDLFYRINQIRFKIPPLCERRDDIPVLIDYFVGNLTGPRSKPIRFTQQALTKLIQYNWPGNVRELRYQIETYHIRYHGELITAEMLPPEIADFILDESDAFEPKHLADKQEKTRIREALLRNKWNQFLASKELNISPATLHRRMKKYGIKRPRK